MQILNTMHDVLRIFWDSLNGREYSYFCEGSFGSDTAYAKAADENLKVVLPEKNQLFVDIDNPLNYATYLRNHSTLESFYSVKSVTEAPSKSGTEGKVHITITLSEEIDDRERLLLQAFLGSDLKREFLGLQRVKANDPHPTLFLEKDKKERDQQVGPLGEVEEPF